MMLSGELDLSQLHKTSHARRADLYQIHVGGIMPAGRPPNGEKTDLGNSSVQAFAEMTMNQALLDLQYRHGCRGLRALEDWEEYHEAAHRAVRPIRMAGKRQRRAESYGSSLTGWHECPEARFQPPIATPLTRDQPTDAQRRAAYAADIRNPTFVNASRGTRHDRPSGL